MTRRLLSIIAIESVIPLPAAAAVAYARPRWAAVFAIVFLLGAVASVIIAAVQWRAFPRDQLSAELTTPPNRRRVWIAVGAAVVFSVLGVIAFQWRAPYQSESPIIPDVSLRRLEVVSPTVLERHYPAAGSIGIPRNSSIFLWFDQPIDRKSIIADQSTATLADDEPNPDAVRIWTESLPSLAPTGAKEGAVIRAKARSNQSVTIVAFDPLELVGSSQGSAVVTVELKGIKTLRGSNALGGTNAYRWTFTVAKTEDKLPPTLANVFPARGASQVPVNAGIQLTWNEAIDPLSFDGAMEVLADKEAVVGFWAVARGERVTEFFPPNACGLNQCRKPRGCWAFFKEIAARSVVANANEYPRRGVRDFQGNLLSPPVQTLASFRSGSTLYEKPLTATRVQPPVDSSGVSPSAPVGVEFPSVLSARSLSSDTVRLEGDGAINVRMETDGKKGSSTVRIGHERFLPNRAIQAVLSSDIEDMYQNCFASCKGP